MKKVYFISFYFIVLLFLVSGNAFSQTPVPMSSQPGLSYTENFNDIANWTNGFAAGAGANRWGPVVINATGTIPDGIKTTSSTATFATSSTGGVQRGSAETPATTSIELLSTGTTASTTAVAIDFFMDFTGVSAGTLSFDAATKFNSTGDRVGSVKVYWSTNGTSFTELTGTNLPYVATNNVAGSASVTNIVLPAAFNGSSTARLRFYYYNGPTNGTAGSRPKISIDNLVVTATAASTPSLAISPASLTFPSTNINTSSAPQSYTITGTNLTNPVLITTAAPYSICETINGSFTTSLSIAATDVIAPKTIYVQFSPTVAGTPTGSVNNNSTGAVQKTVTLSGTAVDAAAPVITVNPGILNFPVTATGSASASLNYTVTGTNLTNDITVSVAAPYSVSADNTSFSPSFIILKTDPALATGKPIYVKFSPTSGGSFNAAVSNSSTGATAQTVNLTGTGIGLINLVTSPYLQTFDGIGNGLPAGISVKTGATASVPGSDAAFTTTPTLWNNTTGSFKNFASGDNDQGVTQSTATDRAIGLRQTGTVGDPGGAFVFQVANTNGKINFTLDFNLQSLDASSTRTTTWRVDYGFGLNPSTYIVPGTTGILTTGGSAFTNNPVHINFGNALDNQSGPITIRIVSLTASGGSGNRPSTGIDDFTLLWEDPAAKTISLSTTAVNFATTNINTSSTSTYTIVSQTNLNQPILLTATAPFTISSDNITFSSGLSVAPAEAFNKTIYVKFSPASTGVFNGTITHTSTGAVSKNIDLTGEAINPGALAFNFNTCSVSNVPGSGFLSVNITGTQKWACSQYGRNGSNGVDVNGFSGGSAQTDDAWLISSPLNLNNIVNIPVLSFYSRGEYTGPKLQLYVSTTYNGSGTPNLSDWTEITTANFPTPPGTATTAWTLSDNIDLTAYKSAPVLYIAFRYTSSPPLNAARWSVDDIAITDQSSLLSVSPVQVSFGEVAVGSNSASQAISFQAIGSNDLTLTPPTGYQLSSDNNTFTSGPLVITQAVASAGTTLYVRFSPVAKALKVEGNIHVTTTGLNKDIVFATGSSYPKAETFDIACYNISFFGSNSTNTATPADIATQVANISTVMQHLNMDVIGIEEMSNDDALTQLVANLPGYNAVVSNRWSYSFDPPDPSFPPQKTGFIYNTSTMTLSTTEPPRAMFVSMYDSARLNLPGHRLGDYPTGTPSSFWASGRLPFMATFNAAVNGVTRKVRLIVIHAKSGADAVSYSRRQYDEQVLKDSLDAFYASDSVIIIGDYNDRMVTSIYAGNPSSYLPFVNDNVNYNILTLPLDQAGRASFPGDAGMIDHITISNELSGEYISNSTDIEDARIYIPNYNATTASDHLPVFSRFAFVSSAPVITAPTITQPTCVTATGTIVVNATGSSTLEYSVDNGVNWQAQNTFNTLAAGYYTIKVRLQSSPATVTVYSGNPVVLNTPVCNGKTIPGRIEAEAFDAKSGGLYSIATTDAGGGLKVVNITNGNTMDYNVTVQQTGVYTVGFRVATTKANAQFQIKLGTTLLATVSIPNTFGWDNWQTITVSNVSLTSGNQTIRIQSANDDNCDFNWMEYALAGNQPTANAGTAQTIQLPLSQVTLTGSGTSGIGGSVTYAWSQTGGTAATITNPSSAATTVTGLTTAGVRTFRLTVTQSDNQTATSDVTITVNAASNIKTIPGRIEAEAWDTKSGYQYSIPTTDAGGGFKMVGISNGSWLDYNVNVLQTGLYTVGFRVATTQANAQFQIKLGATILGTVSLPGTGSWDNWQTYTISNVSLTAGNQTIRIQSANDDNCDFNWMEYTLAGNQPTANAGIAQTIQLPLSQVTLTGSGTSGIGGSVTYTWSQTGGTAATITNPSSVSTTVTGLTTAGVRTFRLTVTQSDNQTATSDVTITVNAASNNKTIPGRIEAEARDAQSSYQYAVATTDAGGGFKMVGISNGSSMDYNVNVLQTGLYTVGFRVATTQANAQFQIKLGATVLGTVSLPGTGGWDSWQTYTVNNVSLTAGSQTLRIQSINNDNCDFNWMDYSFANPLSANGSNLLAAGKSSTATATTTVTAEKQQPVADETSKVATGTTATILELFPNPVHDQFIVRVNNEYAGDMKIQIIDQSGKVMRETGTAKNKGSNQVLLSAGGLPNGIYLIRIQTGDWSKSVKMIKL